MIKTILFCCVFFILNAVNLNANSKELTTNEYFELGKQETKNKNSAKAAKYYKKACDGTPKNIQACGFYGISVLNVLEKNNFLFDENERKQMIIEAVEYINFACDNGDGETCASITHTLMNNIIKYNDTENIETFFKYANKTCILKISLGCEYIGLVYEGGLGGTKKDINKAVEFYDKACSLGNIETCERLASLYYNGIGVKKDLKKASEYWLFGCNNGNFTSCASLGELYVLGNAAKQDFIKAKELFEKSCHGKEAIGCYNLALLYDEGLAVEQNKEKAKDYFFKGCNYGFEKSCDEYKKIK